MTEIVNLGQKFQWTVATLVMSYLKQETYGKSFENPGITLTQNDILNIKQGEKKLLKCVF